MSNRRIRRALLVPAMAGSLLAAPAAFAWGQASAAPTATCSISGVFPNGKVHLSGVASHRGPRSCPRRPPREARSPSAVTAASR